MRNVLTAALVAKTAYKLFKKKRNTKMHYKNNLFAHNKKQGDNYEFFMFASHARCYTNFRKK